MPRAVAGVPDPLSHGFQVPLLGKHQFQAFPEAVALDPAVHGGIRQPAGAQDCGELLRPPRRLPITLDRRREGLPGLLEFGDGTRSLEGKEGLLEPTGPAACSKVHLFQC